MSEFFSGSLDPTWPHAILLGMAIVASFAVAIGIVLENPKWSLANALVVGGVALEAVCTLLLFGFDEGISNRQQSAIDAQQAIIRGQNDKLITLETRIAPRVLTEEGYTAIQGLHGVVTDIGILPEPHCIECRFLASGLERAFHDAGAKLYGDLNEMVLGEWASTGIMILLPPSDAMDGQLVMVLKNTGLLGSVTRHDPTLSKIRTDIPVLLVGEKFISFSPFPYSPNSGAQWSILPILK